MHLSETLIEKEGYRLHMIPSKKFKTIQIVAKFNAPLTRSDVTKRALLTFVLQQATAKYETTNLFRQALDDLYGATFSLHGSKKGEMHILTASMSFINPKYVSIDTDIVKEAIGFFGEALFMPYLKNGHFCEKIVAREKQSLKQKITNIKDNKTQLANLRLIEEMCASEPYAVHAHGQPEDLDDITPQMLYEYYKQVVNEEPLDIYVIGDVSDLLVEKSFDLSIKRNTNKDVISTTLKSPHITKEKEVIEYDTLKQAKLHLGFRTHTYYQTADYFALHVFNAIYGGTPNSKLFMNVREKNSLAYYVSSRFESHKGIMFVYSGIAPSDYEKAKNIILKELDEMKNGNFSSVDIEEAKSYLINQYKESLDDAYSVVEMLYNHRFSENKDRIDFLTKIEAVTKEDISRVAEKIELDTTYFLTEKEA